MSSDVLCSNRSLLITVENVTVYSMAINNSNSINTTFTVGGLATEAWLTAVAKIVDTFTNNVLDESQINACKLGSTIDIHCTVCIQNSFAVMAQVHVCREATMVYLCIHVQSYL